MLKEYCHLSGVLLPHDTGGSYLDSQQRTTDVELEKKNFRAAGEILAGIWNEVVLDNFPVKCEYLEKDVVPYEEKWVSNHCHKSQYFLQIIKCSDCVSAVENSEPIGYRYFPTGSYQLQYLCDVFLAVQLFLK